MPEPENSNTHRVAKVPLVLCYRARQTTSPASLNCSASRASNHSCSLLFVWMTATSPKPSGLTWFDPLPEHNSRIPLISMITRLLGLLISSICCSTGRSSRYLSSAHIRRSGSPTVKKSIGDGASIVPRVMLDKKPARNRIDRMPRFWIEWWTAILVCRARKAFWRWAQRSWGKTIQLV